MMNKFLELFRSEKIDINVDYKDLKRQGLKVVSKKKFSKFLYQYGKTRVLDGYASVLKDKDGFYINGVSTSQLIKLVNFDHYIGNYILKYLLDFEQRFSTVLINTILKRNNLSEDYVLTEENCEWLVFKSFDEKNDFFRNIFQNVESSNFLRKYDDKTKIPLIAMSMSWTFFNIITLFEVVDIDTQLKVIEGLGLENWNIDVFKSMLHIIRRLRNTISHNDFLIDSKFEIYKSLIKKAKLREDKTFFFIYDVCKLLDMVYPTKIGINNELIKIVNKQRFSKTVKAKVLSLLGVSLEEQRNNENKENQQNQSRNNYKKQKMWDKKNEIQD